MYCTKCGKELDNEAVICPNCGVATANMKNYAAPQQAAQKNANLLSIFGFSLSLASILCLFINGIVFMMALITSLVLSVVGLVRSKNSNSGKGVSIAGIIISSVLLIGFIVLMVIAMLFAFSLILIFLIPYYA